MKYPVYEYTKNTVFRERFWHDMGGHAPVKVSVELPDGEMTIEVWGMDDLEAKLVRIARQKFHKRAKYIHEGTRRIRQEDVRLPYTFTQKRAQGGSNPSVDGEIAVVIPFAEYKQLAGYV